MPELMVEGFDEISADAVKLFDSDRRDFQRLLAAEAEYFDRVYIEGDQSLDRGAFVAAALDELGAETFARMFWNRCPAEDGGVETEVLAMIFEWGARQLAELTPQEIYGRLIGTEAASTGGTAERVSVLARRARRELDAGFGDEVGWTPDISLATLLRLQEVIRLLGQLLVASFRRTVWLEQLGHVVTPTPTIVSEESDWAATAWPENGPPPLVALSSAVQPHAPPGCFFSAPRVESFEMRLSQARECLVPA